jgi:hypothetical protein
LSIHIFRIESFQQIDRQRPQVTHHPNSRLTASPHSIMASSASVTSLWLQITAWRLLEPVAADSIEKLIGLHLVLGAGVTEVVARLEADLVTVHNLMASAYIDAGTHASSEPPQCHSIGLHIVAGVATLLDSAARAAPRTHILVCRPAHISTDQSGCGKGSAHIKRVGLA